MKLHDLPNDILSRVLSIIRHEGATIDTENGFTPDPNYVPTCLSLCLTSRQLAPIAQHALYRKVRLWLRRSEQTDKQDYKLFHGTIVKNAELAKLVKSLRFTAGYRDNLQYPAEESLSDCIKRCDNLVEIQLPNLRMLAKLNDVVDSSQISLVILSEVTNEELETLSPPCKTFQNLTILSLARDFLAVVRDGPLPVQIKTQRLRLQLPEIHGWPDPLDNLRDVEERCRAGDQQVTTFLKHFQPPPHLHLDMCMFTAVTLPLFLTGIASRITHLTLEQVETFALEDLLGRLELDLNEDDRTPSTLHLDLSPLIHLRWLSIGDVHPTLTGDPPQLAEIELFYPDNSLPSLWAILSTIPSERSMIITLRRERLSSMEALIEHGDGVPEDIKAIARQLDEMCTQRSYERKFPSFVELCDAEQVQFGNEPS